MSERLGGVDTHNYVIIELAKNVDNLRDVVSKLEKSQTADAHQIKTGLALLNQNMETIKPCLDRHEESIKALDINIAVQKRELLFLAGGISTIIGIGIKLFGR